MRDVERVRGRLQSREVISHSHVERFLCDRERRFVEFAVVANLPQEIARVTEAQRALSGLVVPVEQIVHGSLIAMAASFGC